MIDVPVPYDADLYVERWQQWHAHIQDFEDNIAAAAGYEEMRLYVLAHEDDIAHSINDFGELFCAFMLIIGRAPQKQDGHR